MPSGVAHDRVVGNVRNSAVVGQNTVDYTFQRGCRFCVVSVHGLAKAVGTCNDEKFLSASHQKMMKGTWWQHDPQGWKARRHGGINSAMKCDVVFDIK